MRKKTKRAVSVVLFHEEDQWVGQCLEYDIAAQASSLEDVKYELMRVLMAHMTLDMESGIEPLENLPPAPEVYWKKFREGERLEAAAMPRFKLPHLMLHQRELAVNVS